MQNSPREYLNFAKVLWVVWVWDPIKRHFQSMRWLQIWWEDLLVQFGLRDCCDNPDIEVATGPGYVWFHCRNCGHTCGFGGDRY